MKCNKTTKRKRKHQYHDKKKMHTASTAQGIQMAMVKMSILIVKHLQILSQVRFQF
jgi:hypothetical protein